MTAGHDPGTVPVPRSIGRSASLLIAIAAGIAWGILSWCFAYSGTGFLLSVASGPAVSVVGIALIVRLAGGPASAGRLAIGAFLPFVVAYYGAMFVAFHSISWGYVGIWLVASVLLAPVAAWLSRERSSGLAAVAIAALAGLATADGSVRALLFGDDRGAFVAGTVFDLVCAAAVVWFGNPTRSSRILSAAFTVPLAVIVLAAGYVVHYGARPFIS